MRANIQWGPFWTRLGNYSIAALVFFGDMDEFGVILVVCLG
jgi:hypothetical protein